MRVNRTGQTIFKIDIPQELDDHPWEQWLGRQFKRRRAADLLYFRSHGSSPTLDEHPMDWSNGTYAYQGPAHIHNVTNLATASVVRALHLIGTPVSTRAGWRFRVAGTGAAIRSSRGTEEGELLISPGALSQAPALVILQANPVDRDPESLGPDRRGYIRLARAFLNEGATAVFVVPPIDDARARAIANFIRSVIAETRVAPRVPALFSLLAELKSRVWADSTPASSSENPVLDVLFFLRSSNREGRKSSEVL